MKKSHFVYILIVSFILFICSCEGVYVGAPCKPETDKGIYFKGLESSTYALETRSVQCKDSICITKTEGSRESQKKYSFCSCRCEDRNGHKYDRNNDKYDDLCECPSGSICSRDVVNNNIEQIPDTIKGSYCVPSCIAEELCFESTVECKPPKDSKEPWKWECKTI